MSTIRDVVAVSRVVLDIFLNQKLKKKYSAIKAYAHALERRIDTANRHTV